MHIMVPDLDMLIWGDGARHRWQYWKRRRVFEMKTMAFGSGLTSFPLVSSLRMTEGERKVQKNIIIR